MERLQPKIKRKKKKRCGAHGREDIEQRTVNDYKIRNTRNVYVQTHITDVVRKGIREERISMKQVF